MKFIKCWPAEIRLGTKMNNWNDTFNNRIHLLIDTVKNKNVSF